MKKAEIYEIADAAGETLDRIIKEEAVKKYTEKVKDFVKVYTNIIYRTTGLEEISTELILQMLDAIRKTLIVVSGLAASSLAKEIAVLFINTMKITIPLRTENN